MKAVINRGVLAGAIDGRTFSSFEILKDWVKRVASDGLYNTIEMYQDQGAAGAQEYCAICRDYGLKTIYIAGGRIKFKGLDLSSPEEGRRIEAVNAAKQGVDESYAFNAKKCLLLCGGPVLDHVQDEIRFSQAAKSLSEILRYCKDTAQDYVMPVTFEVFSRKRDPFFFLGSTETTLKLLSALETNGYHMEITYDLAHFYLLEEDTVESFMKLSPYISHIHLSNCVMDNPQNPFYGDKHPLFGIPESRVDKNTLHDWVSVIAHSGFFDTKDDITISYEVITPKGMDPEAVYLGSNGVYTDVLKRAGLFQEGIR